MYGGGTSENYRHGPDTTLTRAHVEAAQRERLKKGRGPLTADEVVRAFVAFPQERHYRRAYAIFRPTGAQPGEARA